MATALPSRATSLRRVLIAALACGAAIACGDALGPQSIWGDLRVETDRSLYAPELPVAIARGERHVDMMHINEFAYTGTWRVVLRFTDDAETEAYHASKSFRVLGTWKP